MPPLSPSSFPLLPRSEGAGNATNATNLGLEVVCAWPVSGQYGPGTRVLYYVLIAACVFARKEEWIRNACLAGALLFPAIAALHGIVLAAVHVDGAIDMDVYGAFQLCSIGILTAPLTARMSGTYFNDPRRHIIFLWTGLVLAGLLSITVEFFRVKPSTCTHDDNGTLLASDISKFPYGATCDLRCSVEYGPFSPIRVDSTNEIYVVPAPNKLTFGTATLLAAACCIPAIVSLLYFWSLILQETWKSRFDGNSGADQPDKRIEGTKATVGMMQHINDLVRTVLSTVEAPVFAAAVLAILILGEKNFFSDPVDYGTERISSIGQWAPIAGAAFAVLGSLYLFLTGDGDSNRNASPCKCTCHSSEVEKPICVEGRPSSAGTESVATEPQIAIEPQTSAPGSLHTQLARTPTPDFGSRRRIRRVLIRLGISLSNAAHDRLHDYEFKQGPASDFPEIPAEQQRNGALQQIREQYNPKRDSNRNISLSRQGSNLSMASNSNSPRSSRSRSPSPFRTPSPSRSSDARGSSESQKGRGSSADDPRDKPRKRTNTLEVPVPSHHVPLGHSPSVSSVSSSSFTIPGSQASPTIVVSGDDDIVTTSRNSDMHSAGNAYDSDSPLPLQSGRRPTS
ncbi:hypothetical protein BJX68DRAFT_235985 [Aspergillus pseudodeflectus]|uniref:Uncharacterized protein n=1 Tax=Aspergillus pseudodeflectus TaxID=176178 RepID=A0ABR4KG76_9EURO